MTARIEGFVSRAEAGLRAPKSYSSNITPNRGGVAIHYGGPRQPCADPGAAHEKCVLTWRLWQIYHMDTHGWADIAYTGGFCNHGYAFAGRGAGVRTAANGTNAGNQNYYAITWIGGEGQTPSPLALDAADWWLTELRTAGGAGTVVRPHRYFKSTGCPGTHLIIYASNRNNVQLKSAAPVVKTYFGDCRLLQRAVRVEADNWWGPDTEKACNAVRWAAQDKFPYGVAFTQEVVGTKADGAWGPNSQEAFHGTVVEMQKALTVMGHYELDHTGLWNTETETIYQRVRKICLR